jgi:hypothetical protein
MNSYLQHTTEVRCQLKDPATLPPMQAPTIFPEQGEMLALEPETSLC